MTASVPTSTEEVQDLAATYIRKYDQAERVLADARGCLAEQAATADVRRLAGLVNDVADAVGYLAAAALAKRAVEYMADPDRGNAQTADEVTKAVLSELYDSLARGADDEWSGRHNDARRAQFDGFRKFAASIRWF